MVLGIESCQWRRSAQRFQVLVIALRTVYGRVSSQQSYCVHSSIVILLFGPELKLAPIEVRSVPKIGLTSIPCVCYMVSFLRLCQRDSLALEKWDTRDFWPCGCSQTLVETVLVDSSQVLVCFICVFFKESYAGCHSCHLLFPL
jgi:hypothetical protein